MTERGARGQAAMERGIASCRRGNLLLEQGKQDEAKACYLEALALDAECTEACINLGFVLKEQGLDAEAEPYLARALELGGAQFDVYYLLGSVARDQGRLHDAITRFEQALELKPDSRFAWRDLCHALSLSGKSERAKAAIARGMALDPEFADFHYYLGNLYFLEHEYENAVASFARALALRPDYAEVHSNLGLALQAQGKLDEALVSYRQALRLNPQTAEVFSNYLFCLSHSETVTPAALFAEHRRFSAQFEAPLRAGWKLAGNSREPERRLRIGLVSADLNDHAVALFLEPLLVQLAKSPLLSLRVYYNRADEDHVTRRLRALVPQWRNVVSMPDAELAALIAGDGIDILIDLSGHTGGNRLPVFARKPAPVQASWIGYPGTTGMDAMDYYLAGRDFLPPGVFDDQFSEKLAYLPSVVAFDPALKAPPVNRLPALANGYLTFGSFNRPSKLNRSVIGLWCQLLRALPEARMLLGGMPADAGYAHLVAWFSEEGIGAERLRFHARCPQTEYFLLHHEVDICLDTFPYTGGTTTNCALWMGVPTLTLAGGTPAGRQGAANLAHVGLERFAARTAAEFVQKGLQFAGDLDALATVRAGLRERFAGAALRRPEVVAAGVEAALRGMWRRWCAGLPPASFEVA